MSESQLSPGTVVDGAYTLDAFVRSRAGATTYVATDSRGGGDTVWVTIYDGSCFASGLALERSLRELRQLKSVNSPRVLRMLDAGKHGDGLFEVTDVGPQRSLAEHLQDGGELPLQEAAALIVQVGEAVLEGQRVGVIHRNLGADVVFPSEQGVRVGGFAVGEPQTRGAGPLLTMAPEQVQGKVVDQRTLIYNIAALMQWMIAGRPLFVGAPDAVLSAHETVAPDEGIDPKLRRALGKDPRMRPMMLKQFLSDIAHMGGVEPPRLTARVSAPSIPSTPKAPVAAPKAPDAAVSRPSSRGWTMFMQAQDDEPEKPAEPEPPPSKPSTRGWTMFMQAQDDEPEKPAEPEAAPAEPEAAPAEAAPAESAPAEGAPSTRGWTMFMKNEDGDEDPVSKGQGADAEQAPASDDAAASGGSPSTRGWTMFTKDEPEPGAEPAPEPPPAEPEPAGSPSTRGWTMFTKDDEEAPEAPPSSASEQKDAASEGRAPSSRGWTMFMEPGEQREGEESAAAKPAAPSVDDAPEGEEAPKKRGWTMFMNAPIEDLKKADVPGESQESKPAPNVEAADQKGWTVFGAPAPNKPGAEADAPPAEPRSSESSGTVESPTAADPASEPVRGKTIMVTNPTAAPAPASRPDEDAPDAEAASAPTVVNTGPPSEGTPVQRGKTMVAVSAPDKPDTMYFKKGEVEPEGGVSARAPTVRDVPSPAPRPVEERVARPEQDSSAPAVPEPTELEPAKSSNTALYAIAGAVVVVAAIAAYFAFS